MLVYLTWYGPIIGPCIFATYRANASKAWGDVSFVSLPMTLNAFSPAMSCLSWSVRKMLTLDEDGRARHRSLPEKQLIRTLSIIYGTVSTY